MSEIIYESDGCVLLEWIVNVVNVYVALIKQMMEYVDGVDGTIALLLAAKNQIDPLMQMLAHIIAFQRLTMHTNEFTRILLCPRWQNDVIQCVAVLFRT